MPEVTVRLLETMAFDPRVQVPVALLKRRLYRLEAPGLKVWFEDPVIVRVPEEWVKVLLFTKLPATVRFEEEVSVPASMFKSPSMVFEESVKDQVPPPPTRCI